MNSWWKLWWFIGCIQLQGDILIWRMALECLSLLIILDSCNLQETLKTTVPKSLTSDWLQLMPTHVKIALFIPLLYSVPPGNPQVTGFVSSATPRKSLCITHHLPTGSWRAEQQQGYFPLSKLPLTSLEMFRADQRRHAFSYQLLDNKLVTVPWLLLAVMCLSIQKRHLDIFQANRYSSQVS